MGFTKRMGAEGLGFMTQEEYNGLAGRLDDCAGIVQSVKIRYNEKTGSPCGGPVLLYGTTDREGNPS